MEKDFSDFLNFLRINRACTLLKTTSRSVTDIAFEVGYNTVKTFNRNFLKFRGMSPSAFRQEIALQEKHIRPCRGCQSCDAAPHVCPLARTDDAEAVFAAIAAADVVLWTSPVYFYGLPAQAKALVDRSQRIWAGVEAGRPAGKGPLVLAALAAGRPRGEQLFTGSLLGLKYFFASFGARIADTRTLRGLACPEDLLSRPDLCADLERWGRDWAVRLAEGRP